MQTHRRHQSQMLIPSRRSFPQLPTRAKTKIRASQKLLCYDWVFSSATNVHVAIDKSNFKTFAPLDSYVLTVSGSDSVPVRGIGSIELKIRCKPASNHSRTITLEHVLYIPAWVCNIFSDVYFNPADPLIEHHWTDSGGLQFTKKSDDKTKAWGYTEPFCGLDRLVLSRKMTGRSPMQEDREREIWSVNLSWPQSQQDKWDAYKNKELRRLAKEHEKEILAQQCAKNVVTRSPELLLTKNQFGSPNPKLKSKSPISPSKITVSAQNEISMMQVLTEKTSLMSLGSSARKMTSKQTSTNLPVRKEVVSKVGSLKASFNANRGLLKEFLAAGAKS